MARTRLRLILGDQLNASHSWYRESNDTTLYVIAELRQESVYVKHHIQKICAFFAAMSAFARALEKAGHRIIYLTLDDTKKFTGLPDMISQLCQMHDCDRFEYQRPDELRLLKQLRNLSLPKGITTEEYDTEHFLLPFDDIGKEFKPRKHHRMESFYRRMRQRFVILVQDGSPEGGKWNFDHNNRDAFQPADLNAIPAPKMFKNDVSEILTRIKEHNLPNFGTALSLLLWPVNRTQALALLDHFCESCLPRFGKFQDAMTKNMPHKWSLYHSRLSFALNTKMLHPKQVINAAIDQFRHSADIDIAQVEGFIRQILGWREYVRGIYWANAEHYNTTNSLSATNKLPKWYWTGDTKMACMREAITQSLEYAYAHHIQRLMITGNFALLAGINPDEVESWYLGIYIDALEWVEQPNTRSMALFADGGWIATKPYAASANYINKMSDYCHGCSYNQKEKTSDDACPFNALYWDFLDRNKATLGDNPRMTFPYKSWQRMKPETQDAIRAKAKILLQNLDRL